MPEPAAQESLKRSHADASVNSLSVVVITRDEEHNLERCLSCLKFASEIIVADSGSTDRTPEVARRHTRHVFQVAWRGFGPTKQAALERATGDWVLSVDADEVVDDELASAIAEAVRLNDPLVAAYRFRRRSNFLGTWIQHSGWYPDWVVRLGRRTCIRFTDDPVHERLQVAGSVEPLRGHLLHYTDPDWRHYLAKLSRYSELSAQGLYAAGRRAGPFDLWARPLYQFLRTYILQAGALDGRAGFLLACGSAFHVFSKYARLWDLSRRQHHVHSDDTKRRPG